jgi:D-alanine transaminase
MSLVACLNGQLMPADEAKVSIWDRGFLLGDAVYEVFRLYHGRCWLEDDHYGRLRRSLKALEFLNFDHERLARRVRETIAASGIDEGVVYIQVTRGVAPRHHHFPGPEVEPTELIVVWPYDDAETARRRGTGVATISQPDLRWKRCNVKSTNLLPNVLANEAAHRAEAYEAILVAADGRVSEATHSSVLWVRGGRLEGTPEGPGILPGTTRRLTLHLAEEESIPFAEAEVTLDELRRAEEVMLVGTTIEVLPIVRIDDTAISGGRPGPIAQRLQAAYRRAVERWLSLKP